MRQTSFRLCLTRPASPRAKASHTTEWLPGNVAADEVVELAQSLVDDPRDTIVHVCLWNNRLEQFDARVIRRTV